MFGAQLEIPLAAAERAACRTLFSGPTGWVTTGLLRNDKHLGLPAELPDLHVAAQAAKCRVYKYECFKTGGLHVAERVRIHDRAIADRDFLDWTVRRGKRIRNSSLHNLQLAHDELQRSPPDVRVLDSMTKQTIT